jgi:two-component system OmpR family response regulator
MLPIETRINNVYLDSRNKVLSTETKSVTLRTKEVGLLEYLMRHPNQLHSSEDLLKAVWASDTDATPGTVRTWVLNLRKKLEELGEPDLIQTVRGSGYIIELKSTDS